MPFSASCSEWTSSCRRGPFARTCRCSGGGWGRGSSHGACSGIPWTACLTCRSDGGVMATRLEQFARWLGGSADERREIEQALADPAYGLARALRRLEATVAARRPAHADRNDALVRW